MSELTVVKANENTTAYKIVFKGGGGVLPHELQGEYSAHKHAQQAIDIYVAKRDAEPPYEKPDSEKDIIELLNSPRPRGRPRASNK